MATLRDIKRRITSVTNTQKITAAMKMISAAKLNRAQVAAKSSQPYSHKLRLMVTTMAHGLTGDDHPLFQTREEGKSLIILFTSDRGLCGGFNNNLNRLVYKMATGDNSPPEVEFVIFGRKGNDFFRRRNMTIVRKVVQVREAERKVLIKEIFSDIITRFLSGEINRVYLAYNHFMSPIRQDPIIQPLLPITPPDENEAGDQHRQDKISEGQEPPSQVDDREILFEPSQKEILDSLLPRYIENQGLLAHLNTEAGEHGARMVAMEGATKNAGEMISSLTLQYNRLRQAAITTELIEIISGAESL